MDTQNLVVGSRFEDAWHGKGIVTYVGTDYIGIAFDDRGDALIRRDALESEEFVANESSEPSPESLPWPVSTFIPEDNDVQHFMGSHWDSFAEDSKEILGRLPEMLPSALVQTGYGADRKPSKSVPEEWTQGFQLVWPLRTQGLTLILRIDAEANMIVSLFPFFATGSQHTMTLHKVVVWDGGLEAQITAGLGGSEVTFFDTQYLINRAWYEAGKSYEFVLTGMAYSASPAEKQEWTINRHPEEVAWMNQRLKEGEKPHEASYIVRLDGAALLLPIEGWDVDDYSFHAPVKSVKEFNDWLGQDGWRVRATVMRFGDEAFDLDILITRRTWTGEVSPQVGQDIEGRLWLQGYLWMPNKDIG